MVNPAKKLVSILVSAVIISVIQAQPEAEPDCMRAAVIYSEEYIAFLAGEKEDVAILLFQWEQACGTTEPLFRARALQLLAEDNFPGMLHEKDLLDMALAFRTRYEIMESENTKEAEEYFAAYSEYFGHIPFNSDFDRQTIRFARNLLPNYTPGTIEYGFLSLYSGDIAYLFDMLRREGLNGSPLSEEYFERVSRYQKMPEFNFGITAGYWMPDSDLTIIGNKPILGIFAGIKKNNFYVNGVFEMRFGKTLEPFTISLRDTMAITRNHQAGFLGVELSRIFWSLPGEKIRLGAGISGGYDVIDIVEDTQSPIRQTFGSFSFRVGPVLEYHTRGRLRLFVMPQWSYLSHNNASGSPLNGNAFNIVFGIGMTDNPRKWQNLERLGY